jgi:hypothetical protein
MDVLRTGCSLLALIRSTADSIGPKPRPLAPLAERAAGK